MKYSSTNKPLVCMQTQSTCYKGTRRMNPKGVLWHGTGVNNPTLKRYIQPSDVKPAEDTYSKEKWLEVLGKNTYGNDWNHIDREAGLNCWIGKLADGTVAGIQTMPWDFRPWGCGSGPKGSCNDGWMQFEICEDALTDKNYFEAVYKEACEITAYYCKMYNINPLGTVVHNGVIVPTILCHQDSYKLGLGGNHSDVYNWFNRYGKTMDNVRNDVAKLLNNNSDIIKTDVTGINITYQTWDDVKNAWLPNVTNDSDYAGIFGHDICAIYANLSEGDCVYKVHTQGGSWLPEVKNRTDYAGVFNKPIDGFMIKSINPNIQIYYQVHIKGGSWLPYVTEYNTSDNNNGYAGILNKTIDGIKMYAKKISTVVVPTPQPAPAPEPEVQKLYRVRTSWADSKSQKGAFTSLDSAIACCQSAGPGYKVYDWNGKEVYAYVAPKIEPTPTPTPETVPQTEVEVVPIPKPEIEVTPEPEPEPEPEILPVEPIPEVQIEPIDNKGVVDIIMNIVKKLVETLFQLFIKEK